MSTKAEIEGKMDKDLEKLLGHAIDNNDVNFLKQLNMQALRELNSGANEQFNGYVEHLASVTI